jgi:hypothetical protein
MPFIDTNLIQSWTTSNIQSQVGINRNDYQGLFYIDNRTNDSFPYPTGYTYTQGKNYQIVTTVLSSNSTIGAELSIKFAAPFKSTVAATTPDVNTTSSGVEFYTYATPLSTLKSKSIVRYGATEAFTQSIITKSVLNEIDFLINGFREYSDLSMAIDDISQPNGWYFNEISGSYRYHWLNNGGSSAPAYSTFGSGLDTIVNQNFIAKPIEYDVFGLELNYNFINRTDPSDGMNIYIVRSDLLKDPTSWGPSIANLTAANTVFATNSLPGISSNGSRNYLVISALSVGTYSAYLDNIYIYGAYHKDNNRLQLPTDSISYSNPTLLNISMISATYSHVLLQNGTPYTLTSRIGNGLFRSGIWENGVWNSGWRDDEEARDFDDVAFSVLTESDISWKIEIRGSTYSIANFATGSAVSIGNIVAIDINDNRKLLGDYYKIEDLGIGYNYSPSGSTQSTYGWIRVNLNTTFPYRRIEKDSQNHKIKVTKNIWLSGGFFNGYFSGVWNNGLFKGYPLITEMFNTHWIDGFFNGGHFNSIYSETYEFTNLNPREACTNGYINLTFETQHTSFLPGDYIMITFGSAVLNSAGYGGVAQIIAIEHVVDSSGSFRDIITIDKIFTGDSIITAAGTNLGVTVLGSVVRYTGTGLIQNFKFYDNNRSKIKSIDNILSTAVFSFNSWIDVNYDETRAVTLGRDFRMYEPLTKKSINRNNLYGYPTYDVLSSLSRFRDSNTLDYKLYKLGTKYKLFTDFIGSASGFNEPFNELDFSSFTNAGWTSSYNNINNFSLKRTENIISLNNQLSTDFLNSGVTGDELHVLASNTGFILNNNNINISKSRYSVVEFDVITHSSVTTFNYKNPDIYIIKSINSIGLTFSETIFAGDGSTSNNSITSVYNITGPVTINTNDRPIDDILVMVDIYGDVSATTINLVAPNGKIINIKRNGSGLGTRLSNTKFSLRDVYTKFSSITTPYSLNNTTTSYADTYLMDKELGQGDVNSTPSPQFLSDSNKLSDLITLPYGDWILYIKYNPNSVIPFDLVNWSIEIQYRETVSVDTEPISTLPVLNLSNLNYDITTQLSGYDNVQIYKQMNYLPIRQNVNHLKVSNTFRLDSIEDSRPSRWGGFGKNQPTKKYEYFYNKTDMMLNINGNGVTGASTSMLVLDNLNMYEVDMIPFFKYFDEVNIYKGIQIPYIGEAPNIDYLNSDFVFVDNITVGVDAIDANGNNTFSTNCDPVIVVAATPVASTTPIFRVYTNPGQPTNQNPFNITQNNTNAIQLSAYIYANGISDIPSSISWAIITGPGASLNTSSSLTPIISGLVSGTYVLRVRAVSATYSNVNGVIDSISWEAFINIGISVPVVPGPVINTGNQNKFKGITYSVDDINLQAFAKSFTSPEIIGAYSTSVPGGASTIKILSLPSVGKLVFAGASEYDNLSVNSVVFVSDITDTRMAYSAWGNPPTNDGISLASTTPEGQFYSTSFKYVIIDTAGNQSLDITMTLTCTKGVVSVTTIGGNTGTGPSPGQGQEQETPDPEQPDQQYEPGEEQGSQEGQEGPENDGWC